MQAEELHVGIGPHTTPWQDRQLCLILALRWSELLNEEKPFSDDEKAFFDQQAQHAYRSFRDKVPNSCFPL